MPEKSYGFTPREVQPNNLGVVGEVHHFSTIKESDASGDFTRAPGESVQLSREAITLLDSAINVAGLMPGDLQFADQEALQDLFMLLNRAEDASTKKDVLKQVVALINAGL